MQNLYVLNDLHGVQELSKCPALLGHEDGLLLCGDAVEALRQPQSWLALLAEEQKIYALKEDIMARGLDMHPMQVRPVDYAEFVALCTDYQSVIAW